MNIPNHVALIPDGNRRWAKKRGLPSFVGHKKGAETLEKIIYEVISLNIPYFSFWGSSLDNITKRSKSEVNYLFNIFEEENIKRALDIIDEKSSLINLEFANEYKNILNLFDSKNKKYI